MTEKRSDRNTVADQPTNGTQEQSTAQETASEQTVTEKPARVDQERRFRQSDLPEHFIERRRHPLIKTEPPPPAAPPSFEDYKPIIGQPELDEIRFLARHIRGKTVKMVNSTAVGGGVAEILNRLVPLMNELEIPTRWEVITRGNDFFEVTKGFHNALPGGEYSLTQQIRDIFLAYNEQNRKRMQFVEDIFLIHDPQPAPLILAKSETRGRCIWPCHIDLSNPTPDLAGFLP